jgi:ligand-binding sensor domain-containing protein/two-component sensor histidine kinase
MVGPPPERQLCFNNAKAVFRLTGLWYKRCMSCRSSLILLLCALAGTHCALDSRGDQTTVDVGGQQFRIRHWTTEDGLPQHHINCLKQTRDGYLWIGTWFGLIRFDGVRFTAYDQRNAPELDEAVNAILEDGEGTLWIGTHKGLVSYRDHRFESVTLPEKVRNSKVQLLEINPDGGLWVQLEVTNLMLFRDGKFSNVLEFPLEKHDRITSIVSDATRLLTVLSRFASFSVSTDASRIATNKPKLAGVPNIYRAAPSKRRDGIWLATEEGFFHLQKNAATRAGQGPLSSSFIEMTHEDRSSNVWVAVRDGSLFCYDGTNWNPVPLLGPSEIVTACCMEQDFEGDWWVGTAEGLFQIRKLPIRTLTTKGASPSSNQAFSISEGSPGSIWVATEGGLTWIRSNEVHTPYAPPGRNIHNSVALVCADTNDVVWTTTGLPHLFRFENTAFSVATEASDSRISTISCLWRSPSGALYCGSSEGVFVFDEQKPIPWQIQTPAYSILNVRAMLQQPDGTFWFAPEGQGLVRVQGPVTNYLSVSDGLSSSNVWSIHQDSDGILWVGTDNGLTRIKNDKFFPITRQGGLLENTVNCVLEDDLGSLWLGGLQRLYRIDRHQLNAFAEGRSPSFDCYSYGIADGMVIPETNGEHQPAACKASDGRLWFPTLHGVVVLDPKLINRNETAPQVLIEQVWADRQIIFGDGNTNVLKISERKVSDGEAFQPRSRKANITRLSPGSAHVVDFRFTATTLIASEQVRFRYRLVNADKTWCDPVSEREVHYENLKPGAYRFEVIGGNYHNVWSTRPAAFEFSIAPYFWQTSTFYVCCATGIFALGAAIQAYRLHWLRRLWKLEEQRALASQRTRIARDLHDDLGTALTGLALEMDVAGRNANSGIPITERLNQTAQKTRDLAERMREVVWSVNPRCDSVSSLASFLEQQVEQFLSSDKVQIRLDFPEDIPDLPLGAEARHQLSLCVREALSNVVRHSRATRATISLGIQNGTLVVQVRDNGHGLPAYPGNGNGLKNMLARMENVGGTFDSRSSSGDGTTLTFKLRLPDNGI